MAINKRLHANNAKTTVASLVGPADTYIPCVDATKFPTITAGTYFLVTLDNGGATEVIRVNGVVGNNLTPCVRAQEGTIASSFPAGSRAENRVTKGTLDSFLTVDNVFVDLATLDLLTTPATSMSSSYICHTLDEGGNPIVAMRNTSTTWRFTTHPKVIFSGTVGAIGSSTTSVTATTLATNVIGITAGKYIIQFITGNNAGLARVVTVASGGTITWAPAFSIIPATGDQFEIYKSTTSVISDLESQSSNSIIYSILLSN